ncbi:MAG: hypothetical protein K9L62_15940 [Vallitaleaceae bacterium]|nr:hypothetical protein [Vallitaleaceae bacterium]
MRYINIKDDRKVIDRIIPQMKRLNGAQLIVGVIGKEGEINDEFNLVDLATVHEFGVKIAVTEKMRNYLAAIGFPLKSSTTEISIPERSFIRKTADSKKNEIVHEAKLVLSQVATGRYDAKLAMDKLGNKVVSMIQKTIDEVEEPPLTQMTISLRSGSNVGASPLQDTGRLWQSIDYEVRW